MGYKSLAQIPARRNRPVSSNVRPHILKPCSFISDEYKPFKARQTCRIANREAAATTLQNSVAVFEP